MARPIWSGRCGPPGCRYWSSTMRIEHYDGINRTPALVLALKAQLELLEAGRCDPILNIFWDQKAIVAFDVLTPVGVLTWTHSAWAKQIDIALGYVEPR